MYQDYEPSKTVVMSIVINTNENQSKFKIGADKDINSAISIDEGVVTPSMRLPKKYWYQDCIILTQPNL